MMRLDAGSNQQGARPALLRDRLRPLPRLHRRLESPWLQSAAPDDAGGSQASRDDREFEHYLDELRALGFQF
jgi:hypothetical protein